MYAYTFNSICSVILYYLAVPVDFKRNFVIRHVTVWTTVLLFVVIDDLPVEYIIMYF